MMIRFAASRSTRRSHFRDNLDLLECALDRILTEIAAARLPDIGGGLQAP